MATGLSSIHLPTKNIVCLSFIQYIFIYDILSTSYLQYTTLDIAERGNIKRYLMTQWGGEAHIIYTIE